MKNPTFCYFFICVCTGLDVLCLFYDAHSRHTTRILSGQGKFRGIRVPISIDISSKTGERKALDGKILEFFSPRYSQN